MMTVPFLRHQRRLQKFILLLVCDSLQMWFAIFLSWVKRHFIQLFLRISFNINNSISKLFRNTFKHICVFEDLTILTFRVSKHCPNRLTHFRSIQFKMMYLHWQYSLKLSHCRSPMSIQISPSFYVKYLIISKLSRLQAC